MEIAVWGHPYLEFPNGKDDQETINQKFEKISDAGITIYFAFTSVGGRLYFSSRMLPKAERDILSKLIKAGKNAGVEIHPIIGFGDVSPWYGLFPKRVYKIKSERELPDWAKRNTFRNWLCPSWKENRELTIKIAKDILENYEVNGIHLDYIRYPNAGVLVPYPCVCDACKKQRLKWLGKEELEREDTEIHGVIYKELQWRNNCVREVVKEIRKLTREVGVKLTMAARAYYLKSAVIEGQDWVSWCKDGLLDIIAPMSYTTKFENFKMLVEEHVKLLRGRIPLFEGIGRKSSAGILTPDAMMKQIDLVKEKGLPGVTIFHLNALTEEDFSLLKTL